MQDLIEGTYSTGHDAFHPGGDDTANNPELGADDFDADDDNHWEIDPSLISQVVSVSMNLLEYSEICLL